MKRLSYLVIFMTFTSCGDNPKQVNNKHITDTIHANKQVVNETYQPDYKILRTMIKTIGMIVLACLVITFVSCTQRVQSTKHAITSKITFRDTVFNLVFDSITHHLGNIDPTNGNARLVKYFKYIGKKPITITHPWTTDPHIICDFPREPLVKNKIYSFAVCFWHHDRQGSMTKTLGFDLSDGNRISLTFTAIYLPIIKPKE